MIYWDLFFGFLRVGLFAFGGAYGAIPLIRDVVLAYGWLPEEAFPAAIAVSESTPGPIMVNLATYVGRMQGGLFGAALATLAVVLPSFIVILLVMAVFKTLIRNPYVQAVLRGLKPCIIGIVLAAGVSMMGKNILPAGQVNSRNLLLTGILAACLFGSKFLLKKKLSPIQLILLAAVLGILL